MSRVEAQHGMSPGRRALLVEDDTFLRRACEASLRQRGFDVVWATQGEEGLRVARTPPMPDLVVVDQLLPKLPGIEVLRALKADPVTASIPVLVLSDSSRAEDRQRAMAIGAAGYYVKANLSLKALAAEVEKLMTAHADSSGDDRG
jgi:two-component system, OmpR family, phosphate regulon response regulator PhoB